MNSYAVWYWAMPCLAHATEYTENCWHMLIKISLSGTAITCGVTLSIDQKAPALPDVKAKIGSEDLILILLLKRVL